MLLTLLRFFYKDFNYATKKREYYYISELGSRLFDLALGEINLAFTAAADKKNIKAVKKIVAEDGLEQFPGKWLEHNGIKYSHLLKKELLE